MSNHRTALAVLACLACLSACSSDDVAANSPIDRTPTTMDTAQDTPPDLPHDTEAPDTEDNTPDLPPDTAPDLPQDTATNIDVIIEDSFNRPDLPQDTQEDPEPDTEEPDTTEPDTAEPDMEIDEFQRAEGQYECLSYSLEIRGLSFAWEEDLILMIWDVRNTCSRPWRMRVNHESDFLPIVVHKDGEPWLAYPDCFERGDAVELAYEGSGNGLRQGWIWIGADHEAWVARCDAAPFDPTAQYSVVGYGATEVAATDIEWSDVFPMSEPIVIELTAP